MKKYYITLYNHFSSKSHGLDAINNRQPDIIINPKIPDFKSLGRNIDLLLSFLTGIACPILKNEIPDEVQLYKKKHSELREQLDQFRGTLENIPF